MSQKMLLSVTMNGLKSDIKSLVVTHNPKTMEKLRQVALLAEKSQPSQITMLVQTRLSFPKLYR